MKILSFEEHNKSDKVENILNRENEVPVIAYTIPGSDHYILAKHENDWVVLVGNSQVSLYSTKEMLEIYNIDMDKSDLERLTLVY